VSSEGRGGGSDCISAACHGIRVLGKASWTGHSHNAFSRNLQASGVPVQCPMSNAKDVCGHPVALDDKARERTAMGTELIPDFWILHVKSQKWPASQPNIFCRQELLLFTCWNEEGSQNIQKLHLLSTLPTNLFAPRYTSRHSHYRAS
jgi:hypothetical protein